MKDLVRFRAMESLCRQSAVFHPHESWRLLAEAEMWHHKAQEAREHEDAAPKAVLARTELLGKAADAGRSLAGQGLR